MPGGFKASPWPLIRGQHATYVDARTLRGSASDYFVFYIVPIAVGVCSYLLDLRLTVGASTALLTTSGLLGALLFGVMLQISDRAMSWTDNPPEGGRDTNEHVDFLRDLAANAGYASLVCIASAVAYVASTTTGHLKLQIATAVGLALSAHLVLVLLMVMRRVYLLTLGRLNRVQTAEASVIRRTWKKTSDGHNGS